MGHIVNHSRDIQTATYDASSVGTLAIMTPDSGTTRRVRYVINAASLLITGEMARLNFDFQNVGILRFLRCWYPLANPSKQCRTSDMKNKSFLLSPNIPCSSVRASECRIYNMASYSSLRFPNIACSSPNVVTQVDVSCEELRGVERGRRVFTVGNVFSRSRFDEAASSSAGRALRILDGC